MCCNRNVSSKSSVSANVNGKETEELNYMFRIRDKSIPKVTIGDEAEYDTNNATTVYYNCFVSYRKKFDKEVCFDDGLHRSHYETARHIIGVCAYVYAF